LLGHAKSSLGAAESSLDDAKSSLGAAESSLGDAKSSLGDAKSSAASTGVLGLWAGFAPNATRSAAISGLEFMGYDYLRMSLLLAHPTMSVPVAAGLAGGVVRFPMNAKRIAG
jgi:hypothetical protein